MRRLTPEEVKEYQLKILDAVSEYCERTGIRYWIEFGTLIGAVRHGGYIPWDDDIDIGMLREDYDRFLSSFNAESDRYKVYSVENDPDFPYAFAKVLDLTTALYEPSREAGNKISINIDIFVFDNLPDDEKEVERMYDRRDKYRVLNYKRNLLDNSKGGFIRRTLVGVRTVLMKVYPKNHFVRKLAENSKKYSGVPSDKVGNFFGWKRISASKEIFADLVDVNFEGRTYKMPKRYDEWLRMFYGDYMKLPPVEEQVTHHSYEAFIED